MDIQLPTDSCIFRGAIPNIRLRRFLLEGMATRTH